MKTFIPIVLISCIVALVITLVWPRNRNEMEAGMSETRSIVSIIASRPTMEGAGVRLHRAFGSQAEAKVFDPFLLLDDFRGDKREDFLAGFPWHPHRGIETITYVLRGKVEHGDSLGNKGTIDSGDVQWMTAGGGIIHQEMPKGDDGEHMWGFQLWANLPASQKMMAPRYRDVTSDQIPEVTLDNGAVIKVICGSVGDTKGPVTDIMIQPEYLDVALPADATFTHPTPKGHTVFAYVFEGSLLGDDPIGNRSLAVFSDGSRLEVTAGVDGARFILVSGKPLGEPIAWSGPVVMNTQEQLQQAFDDYENGTFVK
jgi:redox-sensitive bicupin YhaK (pirin superfamily)